MISLLMPSHQAQFQLPSKRIQTSDCCTVGLANSFYQESCCPMELGQDSQPKEYSKSETKLEIR